MTRSPHLDTIFQLRNAQIAALEDGRLLIRHRRGISLLHGLNIQDLRSVLQELDGVQTVEQICKKLQQEQQQDPAIVRRLLAQLDGEVLQHRPSEQEVTTTGKILKPNQYKDRILVLGNGNLARQLANRLAPKPELLEIEDFAVLHEERYKQRLQHTLQTKAPSTSIDDARQAQNQHWRHLPLADSATLEQEVAHRPLVVCALESAPLRALLEFQKACLKQVTPSLVITLDPDGARLGPTTIPQLSACFGCAQLSHFRFLGLEPEELLDLLGPWRNLPALPPISPSVPHPSINVDQHNPSAQEEGATRYPPWLRFAQQEIDALLHAPSNLKLLDRTVHFRPLRPNSQIVPTPRNLHCPLCTKKAPLSKESLSKVSGTFSMPKKVSGTFSDKASKKVSGTFSDSTFSDKASKKVSGTFSGKKVSGTFSGSTFSGSTFSGSAFTDSLQSSAQRLLVEARERPARLAAPCPKDRTPIRRVGILGGGTAGYLAALALRRRFPHLQVTLVASSRLPVIGVGEATTPLMAQFLHVDLGIDIWDFFQHVQPTFKLGIRFDWGPRPEHQFNYPFGPLRVLEAMTFDGHLRHASLRSMTMDAGRVPLEMDREGRLQGFFDTEIAYHLENRPFVEYLQRLAAARGVEIMDREIKDVELDGRGEEVTALVADDGHRFHFDFYLDCSGFRSRLLGDALDSSFLPFAASLPTDRAWVATVPRNGSPPPYTLAEAMTSGWCWNTPLQREDHRGYVYSSAFLSEDQAYDEMVRLLPTMTQARHIRFRSGRHTDFWKGNVAALGNAYGFVEPLESTALHMLIRQIGDLLRAFPLFRGDRGPAPLLNRRIGETWDYLRWFLALHFRFNGNLNTNFWRHCRHEVDVSAYADLLTAFQQRGPLSHDPQILALFEVPDPLWGAAGIDTILLGQKVATALPLPNTDHESWLSHLAMCRSVVERSLDQDNALAALHQSPETLEMFAQVLRQKGPAYLGG